MIVLFGVYRLALIGVNKDEGAIAEIANDSVPSNIPGPRSPHALWQSKSFKGKLPRKMSLRRATLRRLRSASAAVITINGL